MKRVLAPIVMIIVLIFLSINIAPAYSVERPDWIPNNWIQLTTSPNSEMEPSWSPDGHEIVYRAYEGSWTRDIWVMNYDGTNKRLLLDLGVTEHPDVSPDGTRIVVSQYYGSNLYHLAVMNYDGTDFHFIYTVGSSQLPDWSPTGNKIVFQWSMDFPWPWQIFTINPDGTDSVQLTTQGINGASTWSPDGSKIAFQSDRDHVGQWEVYIMNADGTNQVRLTYFGGGAGYSGMSPSWSPDGSRISFFSRYEGQPYLYVMNADGTGITRLSEAVLTPAPVDWSPDGKWIALSVLVGEDWDIYLMPTQIFPSVGGEWAPTDAIQLLTLRLGLASTMAIAASFAGIRRIRKRQD